VGTYALLGLETQLRAMFLATIALHPHREEGESWTVQSSRISNSFHIMLLSLVPTFATLMLLATSLLVRAEDLPVCDIQINQDGVIKVEDIQKLHNCRTKRFPVSLQNGFTNDLGHYTGSWKNGKRDGQGAMTDWMSVGMTSSWTNDRPSNGLASRNSCMSRTHGYIYEGRFFSFTLPLDWLAGVTSEWGLSWVAEAFSVLGSGTQFMLSAILD
jgi:hypothetical protein